MSLIRKDKVEKTDQGHVLGNDSHVTSEGLPFSYTWNNFWRRGKCSAGVVHTEAITSTTHFAGITGARETTVAGRRWRATIDDGIAAVAFLIPLNTSVVVILAVTVGDTIFHSHVRGASIRGRRESSAGNVIPTHEQLAQNPLGWMGKSHK